MEIFDLLPDGPRFEDKFRRLAASDSRFDASLGRMMLDLIECLRRGIVGPRLAATVPSLRGELLWLQYADGHGHHTMIRIGVDYYDRSPLVDGLPQLHYRLSYDRPVPLTNEEVAGQLEALRLNANGLARAPAQASRGPPAELRTRDVREASNFVHEAIRDCKQGT